MAVGLLMASSPATGERAKRRDAARPAGARWPQRLVRERARRPAHAGDRDARPDAADAGLLPAGLAGRLPRQPGRDPAGHARDHAAGACSASRVAPLWSLGAAIVQALDALLGAPGRDARARSGRSPVAPRWAQIAGLARRRAARAAAAVARRAARRAARAALLRAAARRCRPRAASSSSPPTSARARRCWCARARHVLLFDTGPQYSRESDAGQRVLRAAAARPRRAAHSTCSCSATATATTSAARARCSARSTVDALSSSLEDGHPLLAAAPRPRSAASPASAGPGTASTSPSCIPPPTTTTRALQAERDVVRAARRRRRRAACCSPATSSASRRRRWSRRTATALRSDVLVVPHHGSKTSSSAPFLDAVRPTIAVFQAGYRNRFGHPAAEVLERYRERGIAIVASPACGAWQWRADGAAGGTCQREVGAPLLASPDGAADRTEARRSRVAWRGLCYPRRRRQR